MPRQARLKSETEIYHVMIRGINQQLIFEDDKDNEKFLEILKRYSIICQYKIYAYCLMNNHLHLLIKTEKEDLSQIFKRIGSSYVYFYNYKYARTGHLFQDRHKSEPVLNDNQFLATLRYIHQNPVKAGICNNVSKYLYSSYNEYLGNNDRGLVDSSLTFSIITKKDFVQLNNEIVVDNVLEVDNKNRTNDEKALKIIEQISKCENSSQFQALDTLSRDKYISQFKQKNVSIRQISRLTGISIGIVRKIFINTGEPSPCVNIEK